MLRSFLLNWLASQYGDEIRSKVQEAAAEAVRESMGAVANTADSSETFGRADVGFLFAEGKEYGYFLDGLKEKRTAKGNGLKFTQARYKGLKIAIVETGIGAEAAREGALALLQIYQPRRVISAGFVSALKPEIKRNQLFMPLELISSEEVRIDLRQKLLASDSSEEENDLSGTAKTNSAETKSDPFDRIFGTGTLLSVDLIPAEPREKRLLADKYAADFADTSSFAAAQVCRGASVPFMVLRAAAVLFDEKRSAEVQNITNPGNQSPARLLGALFGAASRSPSSFVDLCKVKENEITAADTLAEAVFAILNREREMVKQL